ncbi:hypothetical protein [Spiroplasma apis]|uniref:Uncharacterized protein n=1 Tax=Spiroplasma apis B31 TaxID=1276258 RepID=V5RHH6_SPIAP|nr:hypothetical protein [Spiroplasma apis]AHB36122.1 hypothetical protein SAPIS_v1c02760 [Spiroplasma apis B31]
MEVCFYCKEIIQENSAFITDLFGENDCLKKYHVDCHQERTNIYKYNEKLNEVEVKNVTKKAKLVNIIYISLAIIFFIEIISIVIILVLKHS